MFISHAVSKYEHFLMDCDSFGPYRKSTSHQNVTTLPGYSTTTHTVLNEFKCFKYVDDT